jgi:hypothetical protein
MIPFSRGSKRVKFIDKNWNGGCQRQRCGENGDLLFKWYRIPNWTPVAHVYNPGYLGGRDQEDHSSKPTWENSLKDPNLKKPFTKKGWWALSSSPSTKKKKNSSFI